MLVKAAALRTSMVRKSAALQRLGGAILHGLDLGRPVLTSHSSCANTGRLKGYICERTPTTLAGCVLSALHFIRCERGKNLRRELNALLRHEGIGNGNGSSNNVATRSSRFCRRIVNKGTHARTIGKHQDTRIRGP